MRRKDNHFNNKQGLYDPAYEHDACGVGMIVNIHGEKSHEIVEAALKVLENMRHRGAEGADNKTGDGAGILLQIPHEFILLQGIPVPEKGKYGTGLIFLPKDEEQQSCIFSILIEEIEKEGLNLMHLRKVPVNSPILGKDAQATEPDIKQIFITGRNDQQELELKLYIIRKRIERRITASDLPGKRDFYIVSLSTRNIVYKGMLETMQLRHYFPDLTQPYFTSGLALVHSRFSTNTFPTWSLAQPFRLLAHNGEINTIRGNRGWMEARESVLSSARIPDINDIRPIIQPGMSDSASLDNVLEFFVASGMSLPHAMAMLVPESFNEKNPISEDLKAFYEYHSILMEPWDGPAALLFSDGRYAGGMLDRNGLRPARYLITKNDMMVVASEVGVMDFEPSEIKEKGRLQPGKILLVDTEKGEIYYDNELKSQLANAQPYRAWLEKNRVELNELKSGRKVPHKIEEYDRRLRLFGYSREDIERIIVPMCTGAAEPVGSMGNDTPLAALSDRPQMLYNYFRQQFAQVTNPPIDPIREELVMSLTEYIGAVGRDILTPSESHCKMVRLNHPILTNTQLDLLCNIRYKGFKSVKLPTLFEAEKGHLGLKSALDNLCRQAERSVDEGVNYIILSDRDADAHKAVIPSLLAVSAVHHHLIAVQKRVQTALIVETGEMREVMHAALLLGYGASAVNPYMAFAILDDLVEKKEIQLNLAPFAGKILDYIVIYPYRDSAASTLDSESLIFDNISLSSTENNPIDLQPITVSDNSSYRQVLDIDFEYLNSFVQIVPANTSVTTSIAANPKIQEINQSSKVCQINILTSNAEQELSVRLSLYPFVQVPQNKHNLFFSYYRPTGEADLKLAVNFLSGEKASGTYSCNEKRTWFSSGIDLSEYIGQVITSIDIYPNMNYADQLNMLDTSFFDNFVFSNSEVSSIGNITTDKVSIYCNNGYIYIDHLEGDNVSLFSADGKLLHSALNVTGSYSIPAENGFLIIRIGNQSYKIINH